MLLKTIQMQPYLYTARDRVIYKFIDNFNHASPDLLTEITKIISTF